ncbi:MAG: hypothetical protein WBG30_02325, partial [Psychrilyobacter sp.]
MCGAFFLAMFTVKSNDKSVSIGIIIGMVVTFLISQQINISWIWNPAIGFVITSISGYLFSCFIKSNKSEDEKYKYTLIGQRKKMISDNEVSEEGVSKLPLEFDRYSIVLIVFFLLQYIILYSIGNY